MIYKYDIWKEPDYQSAYKNGKSRELLLWQKLIRDSIPINSRKTTDENYKSFVTALKNDVEKVQSSEDCFSLQEWLKEHSYTQRPISDGDSVVSEQGKGIVNGAMFNVPFTQEELEEKEKNDSFLVKTVEDKISDRYAIVEIGVDVQTEDDTDNMSFTYKGNSYMLPDQSEDEDLFDVSADDGPFVILDTENADVESMGWVNKAAALNHLKDISASQSEIQNDNLYEVPLSFNDFGISQKTIENLQKDFGFKSVSFIGQSSEEDREKIVNETYKAFDSLAKALEISKESVGLNGVLNLQLANHEATSQYLPKTQTLLVSKEGNECVAGAWTNSLTKNVQDSAKDLPKRAPYSNHESKPESFSETSEGACWILDECKSHNCVNSLLNKNTEFIRKENGEEIKLYPVGDERQAIGDTFDAWKEKLIQAEILHKEVKEESLIEIDVPEPSEDVAKKLFGPNSAHDSLFQTFEQKVG